VRARDGREALLDDVVGPGFHLLWRGEAGALDVAARAVLERLRAVEVAVVDPAAPGAPPAEPERGVASVSDLEGHYGAWFEEHGARAVLVRPDHAVFGVASDDEGVADLLRALEGGLCGARAEGRAGAVSG
jgi:hypothetical protein